MPAPVSRQKINLPSMHLSADDRVGRITEWRFDALLRGIFDPLHLIKAAAADDADCGKVLIHVAQASSLRTDQSKLEAILGLVTSRVKAESKRCRMQLRVLEAVIASKLVEDEQW